MEFSRAPWKKPGGLLISLWTRGDVPTMFLGKNLCKNIHCFVKKVSSVGILGFVGNSFGNFRLLNGIFWYILQLYVSVSPFLHCLGLLGFLRSFAKNKI